MKETEVYGMKYEPKEKEYNQYVETVTPTSNSFRNCLWAFLVGGLICTIGQGLFNLLQYFGWNKNDSSSYVSVILVLICVILTGFNLYKKIAKYGDRNKRSRPTVFGYFLIKIKPCLDNADQNKENL